MPDLPRIVPIDKEVVERSEGQIEFPYIAYAGVRENEDGTLSMRGMGGLYWRFGKCWIWFHRFDGENSFGVLIVRQAKRMLRRAVQLGEREVWCWRDDKIEASRRLLLVIGFEFVQVDRMIPADGSDGGEIEAWRWRP